MLKQLIALIGLGGPEYDARILIRDATAMVEMIHAQHGPDSLRRIATETQTQIRDVHQRGLNDVQFYGRGVEHLTELNRAARARRDNIAWSAITLAIIHIKAEMIEDAATPARNIVQDFIRQWLE